MPFLQEIYPKKHTHAEMFRIGPGLIFFDFNTHSLHNLHRARASSIYNVGATRKRLLCNLNF